VGLQIAADFELAPASLGVLVSTYAWGYAAAQLPAGILADTLGSRKTISLFVLIAAVGSAIFALSPGFSLLALGRFLVGMGVGFVYVPAVRVMADWYRPDELGTCSGVLFGVGSLGALVSATPLVFATEAIGWRGSFLAMAAFTLLAAILCWLAVRDTPAELGFGGPQTGRADTTSVSRVKTTEAFTAVLSNARFYLLAFLLFCYYGTVLSVGSLWAGPYLQHVYGFSGQAAGNVIMLIPLGMALGCPLSGYLSDKVLKSRKKVLIGGAVLHALVYPPLIFMAGELAPAALYALFLWHGITGGA
jgi:predicted MFS family arabinose efflux permease